MGGRRIFPGMADRPPAPHCTDPTESRWTAPGNLYIADTGNNRIRKVDLAGIITTVAGSGHRATAATADRPPARN